MKTPNKKKLLVLASLAVAGVALFTTSKNRSANVSKSDKKTDTAKEESFFSGAGVPFNSLGINGDTYLNLTTGDIHKKENNSWF